MPSLIFNDNNVVQRALANQEIVFSAAARLYKANTGSWQVNGPAGAFVLSRQGGAYTFSFINLSNSRIEWTDNVRDDLGYTKDKPYFHSFYGTSQTIGVSFAEENEADKFFDSVNDRDTHSRRASFSPASSSNPGALSDSKRTSSMYSTSSFSKAVGKKEKRKIDKSMIGTPQNFEHVSHVGYNPKTGFRVDNIPEEWKSIFLKAGITEDQLQNDPKTVRHAVKFMKKQGVPRRAAPPPPPSNNNLNVVPSIPRSSSASSISSKKGPPPPVPKRVPTNDFKPNAPPPPPARGSTSNVQTPVRNSPALPVPPRPPQTPTTPKLAPRTPTVIPPPASSVSSAGAPPPPPPPPPPPAATAAAPVLSLPKATPRPVSLPPGNDGRNDFLSSIRSAGGVSGLKKVDRDSIATTNSDSGISENDLAAALRDSLLARKTAVGGSDSEQSDDDDDDEWD